jgi:hypothetical protein
MATNATVKANSKSTYKVTINWLDDADEPVGPDNLLWTLLNGDSIVVNSRDEVTASVSSGVTNVALYGDDLNVLTSGIERVFVISGTYNSTLGSNLPISACLKFEIACD